jgi:thiol-disulfide isomerase/thioredoxin
MSLTACSSHGAAGSGSSPAGGRRAPAFSLPEVRDPARTVGLSQFSGKPVLINFFGAWCVPCRAELPLLEDSHRRLDGRVGFVGIDTTDSRAEAVALLDETHVTYPAAFDPKGALKARYGVRAMPTTIFVRGDGTIAETVPGKLSSDTLAKGLQAAGAP